MSATTTEEDNSSTNPAPRTTRFAKKKQNRAKRCKSDGFALEPDVLAQEKSTEAVHFLLWIRNPTIHSLAKLGKCIRCNEREWMEDFLSFDGLGLLFQCLNNLANCETQHLGDMVLKMQCASCIREVVNSQSGLDCLLSMRDKSENLFGRRIAFALKTNNMMVKMQIFELLSALCLYSTDGYFLTLEALDRYKVWQKLPYRFSIMVKELQQADLTSFKISLMALINSIIVANENIHDRIRIRNEFLSLNILDTIQGLREINDEELNIQCDVFDEELSADCDALTELNSSSVDISKPQDLFMAIHNKYQDTPIASSLLGILYSLYQIDSKSSHCEATWINVERSVQHCVENDKKDTHYKHINQKELTNQQTQTDEVELSPEGRSSLRRKNGVIIKSGDTSNNPPAPAAPAPPPPPPPPPPGGPGAMPPPPPPPPPPGSGAPPPPPPPGKGFAPPGSTAPPLPPVEEIKTPEPQCKMKMLNWSKVPIQSLRKNSIWGDVAQMKDQIDVKYNKLEELFALRNVNTTEVSHPNEKALKRNSASIEIALLDPKRSMIVNIFLKQFRNANASIIDLIRKCDSRALGSEKIKGLLKILPTQEEVELISGFDGDIDKLGGAEKFYKDLIQIPHYDIRIEGMNLRTEFNSQMGVIRPNIQLLNSLCRQILNSDSLKMFLRFILHAGNFINKGSTSGSAYGFRINSLCKLAMVKSNIPRLSLLHHLVEEALLQNKNALRFVDDLLESLQKASKCTLVTSKAEFLQIRKNVDKFEHQMAKVEAGLKTHFSEFLEEAENDIGDVEEGFERLDNLSNRLRDHFCENNPFNLNDFLASFLEFTEKVKLCEQEVEARNQQEEKAKRRQKAMEDLAIRRKSGSLDQVVANPAKLPENRKIVDNLVNEIKKGKVLRRLSLKKKNRMAVHPLETAHL